MSTPGVSLFQGTESIKVNTSLERAEEEEALEDQRRRNEELGNLLQNAFDDLDEDETTIDSTTNFQSDLIDQQQHHVYNHPDHDYRPDKHQELEFHQLKLLLDSRTRELDSVKQIANEESKKRDEFQKRLTIAEAELDRALASKKNTHELLVESKEKCSNFENTISKLKNDKKALEAENNTLLGKLETSQTLLSDIQRKYDMVERDLNRHNDRNAELKRKHADERHRAEIEMIQQQIDQLTSKLDKKTNELDNMNTRYRALQSSHETMLIDKGTKINDLNNALNDAQKKCDELLSHQDYFQENIRLQKLIASLQNQIQDQEKTIAILNERLEFTTAELDVMDSVLHQHNMEDTPRRLSQTQGRVIGSTPLNTVDRVGNLKDELYRALANVKNKRDEIRKLERTLEDRVNEIKQFKDEENSALVQITTLKEENIRLVNRLKVLEEEFEEMSNKILIESANNKLDNLNDELNQLRLDKSFLEKQRFELEAAQQVCELERKKLDTQLKNVEVDLEELKQEHDNMKLNYEQVLKENQNLRNRTSIDTVRLDLEKHKFLLKDAQTECDRLKNLYVDISNTKEMLSFEFEKLRSTDSIKQLNDEREKVEHMHRALQLAELKTSEITKILEAEKACHEREIATLKEKMEKEKTNHMQDVKNSPNDCKKCIEYLAQKTKLEIESLKYTNQIAINKKDVDNLSQQLKEAKSIIAELSEKMQLGEQQERLIRELKAKAHEFEEYIKSQSSSSDKSLSPKNTNPIAATTDNYNPSSPEFIKKIEARIRNEMSHIFASEMKRFKEKLHQMDEQRLAMQNEFKKIHAELLQRNNEVELLKQAILAERDNFEEIFKEKETETKDIIQRQNVMLHKCRDELQSKNNRIRDLMKELDARQAQIEAERQSMKAVMAQWETQRKNIDVVEKEWMDKITELKQIHETTIASLQTKYNSAKRTAAHYKRYAEDKDAHMKKEFSRIKLEYELSLAKIDVRIKETMEIQNKEVLGTNEKNKKLENNKENKMKN